MLTNEFYGGYTTKILIGVNFFLSENTVGTRKWSLASEPGSDGDEHLEILSVKCSIPVPDLSLTQLTADQLGNILSVLDKLLFDEWISAHPSLNTLQHTQVFITELCILCPLISQGVSLQSVSGHVQSLVESISESACNVFESFLLTQALYLNLMHFFSDYGSSDNDTVNDCLTRGEK